MSDVAALKKRVAAGDEAAIPLLAKLAKGKAEEDVAEAAVKAIAASDSDLACETLCELAAAAANPSIRFAAMEEVDRKMKKHAARVFPMVIAACERHPTVDENSGLAVTFSDVIYTRKRADPRELALVRRQLFAPDRSVREQAIAIIGRVKDKDSIATLYRVLDEYGEPDDEDDATVVHVAESLVALGIGGAAVKKARLAATRSQGAAKRDAARAALLVVLREARPE